MSEALFDSAANQRRIRTLSSNVALFLFSRKAQEVIAAPGRVPDFGWGMNEFRSSPGILATRPSKPGEFPAETTFYPNVPALGITGGVYWHGEGSNSLRIGRLLGMYLDETLVDGKYVNYLELRQLAGSLVLGHTERDGLRPPSEDLVTDVESKVYALVDYVRE